MGPRAGGEQSWLGGGALQAKPCHLGPHVPEGWAPGTWPAGPGAGLQPLGAFCAIERVRSDKQGPPLGSD